MRELREGLCRTGRQPLTTLPRTKTFRVRHRPLELVPNRSVREVLQHELVPFAHAVRPVGRNPEPDHVRDDEKRRVLEREGVLPQLIEGGVEVRVLPFVLPGEAVALPHVGPAACAAILASSALEAVGLAGGIGFGR